MINKISSSIPSFQKSYMGPIPITDEQGKIVAYGDPVHIEETVAPPLPTLLAYMINNIKEKAPVKVSFSIPMDNTERLYSFMVPEKIRDLKTRIGKPGQVLNWIDVLPKEQLKRLDEIYELADSMKQNGGTKLGIIGIGGSKHTIENMLSLNRKGDDVVFLSAVDPDSINKFVEKLGDLRKANIMVASKSGTTLEPSIGYEAVEKIFIDSFKSEFLKKGLSDEVATKKAKEETAKHIVCITDKDPKKSKLRQIANEKGYKCGIIHDDCGGRFGAFDDHALTALAWAGMDKTAMKKMLESSLKAQKKFLNENLEFNTAMKRAIFNADCVLSGKTNQHDYYFGDVFEGTTLWNTQMKKESHKSLYKVSADLVGPAFLHNSTESDLDEGNKTSFYTFNKLKNDNSEQFRAYNALFDGSYKAYSDRNPVSVIELKDLSPQTIGEFVELKHFETLYTGMLLREMNSAMQVAPKDEVLPEVLQPSVGIYKNEVKKILENS